MVVKKRGSTKNPPILSHEFMIQNHADIVACFAMIFVVGLMFQTSSPAASLFIAIQHNVTVPSNAAPHLPASPSGEVIMYTAGLKDACGIFFYLLISIVMHAILQEYVLDKMNRKLHLSRSKHAKFNESGQLVAFYLVSVVWAVDLIFREFPNSIHSIWEGYPHTNMSFSYKFFFLLQLSYWLHTFPDLYFHKVKNEDILSKVSTATIHILLIGAAYVFSFTRVALALLLLQYTVRFIFHAARLVNYSVKMNLSEPLFKVHDLCFVLARLGSITVAVLTFWYGLALSDDQVLDFSRGNFNTPLLRLCALVVICLRQAWLMWNFITLQLKLKREKAALTGLGSQSASDKKSKSKMQQEKAAKRKERQISKKEEVQDDVDDLPEVDQAASKTLRQRK
ncbi:translocating chain-associated membrane protein 1-like 1 [Lepeophtheirus salmonis]|uniref:translocating chain-associated membrane protein 1-like 1 n=1 Tax=Lepeophtheirus salmonis TaxID=72036 RepID=UPI001AEB7D21|nr:translocating chain-associated membrane protein 1-like 1 [Lepeophtheirus salmonis]